MAKTMFVFLSVFLAVAFLGGYSTAKDAQACRLNGGSCKRKCDAADVNATQHSCRGKNLVCCMKSPCEPNGGKCVPMKKCASAMLKVSRGYSCPGKKVCCQRQTSKEKCKENKGKCVPSKKCSNSSRLPEFSCPGGKNIEKVCCKVSAQKPIKTPKPTKSPTCKANGGQCVNSKKCQKSSLRLSQYRCPDKKVCCNISDQKPTKTPKPTKLPSCKANGGQCVNSKKCQKSSLRLSQFRCPDKKVCCNVSDQKPTKTPKPTKLPSCKANGGRCLPTQKCSNSSVLSQFRCPTKNGKVCCKVPESKPSCPQSNGTCVLTKKCSGSSQLSQFSCPNSKKVCCQKKKACRSLGKAKCVQSKKCKPAMLQSEYACPNSKVCCHAKE